MKMSTVFALGNVWHRVARLGNIRHGIKSHPQQKYEQIIENCHTRQNFNQRFHWHSSTKGMQGYSGVLGTLQRAWCPIVTLGMQVLGVLVLNVVAYNVGIYT